MSKKIEVTTENFGNLLIQSANEALSHSKGKLTLKSESLELPPEPPKYSKMKIKKIRKVLNVSQSIFAEILNVSTKTVQAWEIGTSTPNGPACRLLQIIENDYSSYLNALKSSQKIA